MKTLAPGPTGGSFFRAGAASSLEQTGTDAKTLKLGRSGLRSGQTAIPGAGEAAMYESDSAIKATAIAYLKSRLLNVVF